MLLLFLVLEQFSSDLFAAENRFGDVRREVSIRENG